MDGLFLSNAAEKELLRYGYILLFIENDEAKTWSLNDKKNGVGAFFNYTGRTFLNYVGDGKYKRPIPLERFELFVSRFLECQLINQNKKNEFIEWKQKILKTYSESFQISIDDERAVPRKSKHRPILKGKSASLLQSLKGTSWILVTKDDLKNNLESIITFLEETGNNSLLTILQKRELPKVKNEYPFIYNSIEEKGEDNDDSGEEFDDEGNNDVHQYDDEDEEQDFNKSDLNKEWKGESKYYKNDTLLSITLSTDDKNHIRLDILMDDRLEDTDLCIGQMLSVQRKIKFLVNEIVAFVKEDIHVDDSFWKFQKPWQSEQFLFGFKNIISKQNIVPLNPIIHDFDSMFSYFDRTVPISKYGRKLLGDYLLFFNERNTTVHIARLRIQYGKNSILEAILSIPKPQIIPSSRVRYSTWRGELNESFVGWTSELKHYPISIEQDAYLPIYLSFNKPNSRSVPYLLTGSIFGSLNILNLKISSFALGIQTKFDTFKKIGKKTIIKIVTERNAGDDIKLNGNNISSLEDIYQLYEDHIKLYPDTDIVDYVNPWDLTKHD